MSTTSQPQQRMFDLAVAGRPLFGVNAAMAILDRDEDDVLNLITEGALQFAFDIRGAGADRAEVRIWRDSLVWYLTHPGQKPVEQEGTEETERVLRSLFLHRRQTLRRPEIVRAFNCSAQHVANLIDAGLITKAKDGNGVNLPDSVWRDSAISFLRTRRLP